MYGSNVLLAKNGFSDNCIQQQGYNAEEVKSLPQAFGFLLSVVGLWLIADCGLLIA